jgi:non-ribosomal peptide synthetase-like protein
MAVVIGMKYLPWWQVVALSPLVTTALVGASALFTVAIKEALMGKFKPAIVPLWCTYVWLNELVNGVYETTCKSIITPLLGTPFICWFLRLMGCQIGKHNYIETELFSEFDLVHVGDYVSLNAGTVVQNHLFEDRVMKSSDLYIGDECSIGNMTVVLYDTVIEKGVVIAPLSLLMKGETLPENTRWIGIPTSQEA